MTFVQGMSNKQLEFFFFVFPLVQFHGISYFQLQVIEDLNPASLFMLCWAQGLSDSQDNEMDESVALPWAHILCRHHQLVRVSPSQNMSAGGSGRHFI